MYARACTVRHVDDRAHMHRATRARRMQHAPRDVHHARCAVHTWQRAMRALPTYVELRTCSMRHARLRRATMQWAPGNAQRSSARHPEQRRQRVNARHAAPCRMRHSVNAVRPSARAHLRLDRARVHRPLYERRDAVGHGGPILDGEEQTGLVICAIAIKREFGPSEIAVKFEIRPRREIRDAASKSSRRIRSVRP
jgi:hypothetical protein